MTPDVHLTNALLDAAWSLLLGRAPDDKLSEADAVNLCDRAIEHHGLPALETSWRIGGHRALRLLLQELPAP